MRIARIALSNGEISYARLDDGIAELLDAAPWSDRGPTSGERVHLAWQESALRCPVEPSKILCIGRNYAAHTKELGNEVPAEPLLFLKPPSALLDPGGTIVLPPESERVEHEAELGVVIRRRMRNVRKENALSYVFGYTCVGDITARDLQKKDGQWARAKGFDTFCPVGPWIETELDPSNVAVRCRVNGATRQDGVTSNMIFDVPTLIAYTSRMMTLEPGDLLVTGTPEGVGPLAAGDQLEIEVSGVGVLRTSVASVNRRGVGREASPGARSAGVVAAVAARRASRVETKSRAARRSSSPGARCCDTRGARMRGRARARRAARAADGRAYRRHVCSWAPRTGRRKGGSRRARSTCAPFDLDAYEAHAASTAPTPARARSGLSFAEAEAYCEARGKRLPTEDEWIAAAAGTTARRYPWGDTGAVCRRAAWGLATGPCAKGASGPDSIGAHPDGRTLLGLDDMAGNVAEWVVSPSGPVAHGGSWASALATELRTWSRLEVAPASHDPRVGVRCARDDADRRGAALSPSVTARAPIED